MVATSVVFFPAAPLFLFMHGKDITIPQGTEITAYINGDTALDPKRFAPPPLPATSGGAATSVSAQAPPVAAPEPASLTITSVPSGADIQVNGAFSGSTPSRLKLEPGDYTIVVEKKDYTRWERSLKVAAAASITLDATLEPQQTAAPATAPPPASVAAPVQEASTSAQPTAIATPAGGKPVTPVPGTTSASSSPALVEWEGEQQWPGLRFSISFSKGATEITNLKVHAACLEGTSGFEETRVGPHGWTLPIAADGSFRSVTVRNSLAQEILTGRFHADESAEGSFESGISLGCAGDIHFKVSGNWQARPKK
jgi:hypothetical protein